MTATTAQARRKASAAPRPGVAARVLRIVGWTLISAGMVVLLYVVYSLFFTNLETDVAQAELLEEWERSVGAATGQPAEAPEPDGPLAPGEGREPDGPLAPGEGRGPAEDAPPEIGSAVAVLEFVRPGSDERPVRDDPLFVVDDVSWEALTRGPGHYPTSAQPGADGNFAVAGHRTTYGSPFFHLDELRDGDEIHVTDRSGTTHVYAFTERRIVRPHEQWVLGPDPLERSTALLTLTTCHPRFSARERLIVFAELVP